jgi:hypothetical protein
MLSVRSTSQDAIVGYVDIPSELATVSRSQPFYVAGWVFNCADASRPTDRERVLLLD